MILLRRAYVLFLIPLFVITPADGADFHVSNSGINVLSCGNTMSPCKDISYVIDSFPLPDLVIKIASGTYKEKLDIWAIDAVSSPKSVALSCGWNADFSSKAASPGNTVLQSTEPTETFLSEGVLTWYTVNVTVDGCVIENSNSGIVTSNNGGSLSLIVRNSILQNNVEGLHSNIDTGGTSIIEVSENTKIRANTDYGIYWGDVGGTESSQLTIKNSYILDNLNNGIFIRAASDSASGTTTKADFTNTVIAGNEGGFRIGGFNTARFIAIITNSTIADNFIDGSGEGGVTVTATDSSDLSVIIRNSIVWGNPNNGINYDIDAVAFPSASASVTASYSDIGDVNPLHSTYYTSGSGNINADPKLSSTYMLLRGSSAVDKAQCGFFITLNNAPHYIRVAPYDDIDGQSRPGHGETLGCDMGADEFNSLLCFPVKTKKGVVQICM